MSSLKKALSAKRKCRLFEEMSTALEEGLIAGHNSELGIDESHDGKGITYYERYR